jgi:hypothetical protein
MSHRCDAKCYCIRVPAPQMDSMSNKQYEHNYSSIILAFLDQVAIVNLAQWTTRLLVSYLKIRADNEIHIFDIC